MRFSLRRWLALSTLALGVAVAGCGQPVREDRSINWSHEGGAVAFEHGAEGVFVAGKDGGKPVRIFQPGPEVITTSAPLWSPTGRRALFTTARDANAPPAAAIALPGREQDPAGNVHFQRAVVYTCWLYEEGKADAKPSPLFEAPCDHVGYVAANLAVRWHPKGDRIEYLREVGPGQHAVWEYELDSNRSRQVFPHTAQALLFDWTPDGQHFVCVLAGAAAAKDGIWIGQPGGTAWWHVPHSEARALGELPSLLEELRATRPAWTADGGRCAFASSEPGAKPNEPARHTLWRADRADRTTTLLAEGKEPFRDLHWAPDGVRLGVLRETGTLQLVEGGGKTTGPVNRRPVRRFAGWDATGDHLAYVIAEPTTLAAGPLWSFLLMPDPLARDAVYLTDGAGKGAGKEVFSGMRLTFPQWSPKEDKLSLWCTFSPACRSWLSLLLGWGLRPGDPAAIFDAKTGRMDWLAVNPREQVQVGHYYLLKQQYTEALRWYAEAERAEGAKAQGADAPRSAELLASLRNSTGGSGVRLFEYQALSRLGRTQEAEARLKQFRDTFLSSLTAEPAPVEDPNLQALRRLLLPGGVLSPLVRDLYAAEVFLSLDAAADAEGFFRRELDATAGHAERLSAALVLSQVLLLEKKHRDYARLATETLAPLLVRFSPPPAVGKEAETAEADTLLHVAGVLALMPLFAPDFLAGLPADEAGKLAPRWQTLRDKATSDHGRYVSDLVLRALYQRLGREAERAAAAERVRTNPAGTTLGFALGEDIGKSIEELRQQIQALLQRL
jgi:hypothetical protein